MPLMRRYQNVSANPLEIVEVGKPIKSRVHVNPSEISELVHVSPQLHDFLTRETGFARVMEETQVEDKDVPEGYVEITEGGSTHRAFRPMTDDERKAAGLGDRPAPGAVVQAAGAAAVPKAVAKPVAFEDKK